ncbi:hypothetical protein [Pseudomonas atacamensis]|uniref:hypothetical protein n=1 Tax=Pseudomonas atacamensis TaxID=2565368 RepID=UPI0019D2CF63|nr:hypothetical protein [Pseudomonas atacamensis]QSL90521.1 hypothetical protein JWU58_27165 [Pseudomonas atacamensis]
MLNNVAIAMNKANRQRTLREPNSIDCVLFTKKVERTAESEDFDGSPTLGGAGMLSDEDEVNYSWEYACDARIHFAQGYAAPLGNTSDNGSSLDYAEGVVEASIEPIANPGTEGYVQPGKRMLVAVMPGGGIIANFEIVDVTGNLNISPYTRKYLLNPRPDESVTADM